MGKVWICPECGEKNWSNSIKGLTVCQKRLQVRCDNCCDWFVFDNLKKKE